MKKSVLYLLILSTCIYSCKKDHSAGGATDVKPVGKMYKVNINTSGFDQTITSAPGKVTNGLKVNETVASYLKVLYYSVFDSSGKQIHFITQDSTNTSFGTIADSLAAGTYTIQIAAGKSGLLYFTTANPPTLTSTNIMLSYNTQVFGSANKAHPFWQDTFVGRMQFTVTGNVNQNIELNRIVGQLEVVIKDNMPANVSKIGVNVTSDDFYYSPSAAAPSQPLAFNVMTTVPPAAVGLPNFTTDYIIGNTTSAMQVTINAYDAAGNVVATAVVPTVTSVKSQRIVLSGRLFGPVTETFNVQLNPWGPPISISF